MKLMPNEKIVTLKLKRIDVCNLILACTSLKQTTDATKWGILHDKLKDILDAFDEKEANHDLHA